MCGVACFLRILTELSFCMEDLLGLPGDSLVENMSANAGDVGFDLRVGKTPLEKEMTTHSSSLA